MNLPDNLVGCTVDVNFGGEVLTGLEVISDKQILDPYYPRGNRRYRNIWARHDGRHVVIYEPMICAVRRPDDGQA